METSACLSLLGLLADVSKDAAINVQDQAVDEIGCLGSKEHGRATQIFSLTPAACGVFATMNWSKG